MKLSSRLLLHLTLVMVPVLALWSALFYFAIVDEITDEADDSLEDYSELIITRHLAALACVRNSVYFMFFLMFAFLFF